MSSAPMWEFEDQRIADRRHPSTPARELADAFDAGRVVADIREDPSRPVRPPDKLWLQRTLGNRAVTRLLARDANGVAPGAEAAVSRARSSGGEPLPAALRERFEDSLSADLSEVRIHTGRESAQAADAVSATAYTVGQNIHFGAGQYAPGDSAGLRLIAHELAHTVQQRGAPPSNCDDLEVSTPSDAHELEAQRVAEAMVGGNHIETVGGAAAGHPGHEAGRITARTMALRQPQHTGEASHDSHCPCENCARGNACAIPISRAIQRFPAVGLATALPNRVLQRDTVKVPLHPEETGTFRGSFKLPSGSGLFSYDVELYNVSPLRLSPNERPNLSSEVERGIGEVLEEQLKSNQVLIGLPPMHLTLDAGGSNGLAAGYVQHLVARAARAEIGRLIGQSQQYGYAVLQAIVNIMSIVDLYGDASEAEQHPRYYINKTVTEDEDIRLLWQWYNIANDAVKAAAARSRIASAVSRTALHVSRLSAAGKDNAKLVSQYRSKVDKLTARAAKEEVDEMIAAGFEASSSSIPSKGAGTEEERIRSGAARALAALGEISEVSHRLAEQHTTAEKLERLTEAAKERSGYYEELSEYIKKVFRDKELAEGPEFEPIRRASGMSLPDGLTLLKGGLDAVNAIMAVADPEARNELFKARSSYFGKVAQGAEMNAVLWKSVSGAITFFGVATYGLARLAGNMALAEGVLDATVKGIGNVSGPLFLVGVVHGAAVLLDPNASSEEKAEAAVETTSSAVGLIGFASRWIPRLAGFARWSGPIAASLSINFQGVKYLARLGHGAMVGLNRLDWAPCYRATLAAAVEAQTWMRRLAVTDAILATETDAPRRAELLKYADAFRFELVKQQLAPFVQARLSSKSADDDRESCGPAFTRRLKPVEGLLGTAAASDDAALGIAAVFLSIVDKAFAEWDEIVMEKE